LDERNKIILVEKLCCTRLPLIRPRKWEDTVETDPIKVGYKDIKRIRMDTVVGFYVNSKKPSDSVNQR
jgi:hypothetical protein